ncbi:MAG: class I SAM-dependent methyltransferase [Pseudomonadota bacterium]
MPDKPGFFLPYRYADQVSPRPSPAWLSNTLDAAGETMQRWLGSARELSPRLSDFAQQTPGAPHRPRFDQDWFTGLDATMAYTLTRTLAPPQIVEIGSGHSTRFIAQAIEDGGHRSSLHSIDPEPRKDIDLLCDKVTRQPLGALTAEAFPTLGNKDMLFVDGSHLVMPGTDVEQVFTEIVPKLLPGTVVHIHDIFLPDPYPDEWSWRGYNEQSLVLALLGTGRFELLMANAWITRHRASWLHDVFCPLGGGFASSLWIRVRN